MCTPEYYQYWSWIWENLEPGKYLFEKKFWRTFGSKYGGAHLKKVTLVITAIMGRAVGLQWNPVNTTTVRPKYFGRNKRGGRINGSRD